MKKCAFDKNRVCDKECVSLCCWHEKNYLGYMFTKMKCLRGRFIIPDGEEQRGTGDSQ
jgi:hypothetical protein